MTATRTGMRCGFPLIVAQPANGTPDAPTLRAALPTRPMPALAEPTVSPTGHRITKPTATLPRLTITVNDVNQAPIAGDDSYSTPQRTTLTVPGFQGLLLNDGDPDGDVVSVIKVTDPANGTLTALNDDGSFTYIPDPNFSGTDSFTYQLSDGALGSNFATVQITVNAVNRAPVANNDSYSTTQNAFLLVPANLGPLANDSDPDGDRWPLSEYPAHERPSVAHSDRQLCLHAQSGLQRSRQLHVSGQ